MSMTLPAHWFQSVFAYWCVDVTDGVPHCCCYEDHQSRSRTDRKCQNNAAILAIVLMRAARTYTRVLHTYVCKPEI